MPPDGGIILPENVQMKPFFPKSKLDAKLSFRVLGRTVKFNSLPSGHTNLHRRHPGLKKNFLKGVVIVKVHSASFRPEVIENEATEDVQWLPGVGEAAGVIREESWGIIFVLHGGFTEENKRPIECEVAGSIRPRFVRKLSKRAEPCGIREDNVEDIPRHLRYTLCIGEGSP
ncbi:unnamed protein product [Sphagnum troendelagicum]|uniref:Uncharacterized protein n=1 Tax=Sphagnum troendelagicum TaxID=128251 RepID=A0ABP0TJ06_9BRYO